MNRKSQQLSIETIVVIVILLVLLLIVIAFTSGQLGSMFEALTGIGNQAGQNLNESGAGLFN